LDYVPFVHSFAIEFDIEQSKVRPMEEFFTNVSRYPRYLISITLGIFLTALSPLLPLLRRPSTAVATVALLVSFLIFISFVLRAMLGLDIG
jgi:type II secretory pathway component PulF